MKTQINANLHDKTHRHHLFAAIVICMVEIGLIVGVEAVMIHLLLALAAFGHDTAEILLSSE